MASTIIERIIGGTGDKRTLLSGSTPARPAQVLAASWGKLRLAARLCARDAGVTLSSTPRFALGLCHGSTNRFGDATTANFVGLVTSGTNWTRNAGPPVHYIGVNLSAGTRVGSTLTLNGSAINSGGSIICAQPADGYRSLLFVDITWGTPNFTINAFYRNSNTGNDISEDEFLFYAQFETPPSLSGHTLGTGRTVAVDEGANGVLNHINPAWQLAAPQFEISDLAIVKFS